MLDKLKNSARKLKQNIYVLYLAYKDPRIPWILGAAWIGLIVYREMG